MATIDSKKNFAVNNPQLDVGKVSEENDKNKACKYGMGVTYNETPYLHFKSIEITAAQILASNTTPITLVAAPEAGYAIVPLHASYSLDYSTAAYATNTNLRIKNSSGSVNFFTVALTGTADELKSLARTDGNLVAADSLVAETSGGDPTGGGGSYKINIAFYVVKV